MRPSHYHVNRSAAPAISSQTDSLRRYERYVKDYLATFSDPFPLVTSEGKEYSTDRIVYVGAAENLTLKARKILQNPPLTLASDNLTRSFQQTITLLQYCLEKEVFTGDEQKRFQKHIKLYQQRFSEEVEKVRQQINYRQNELDDQFITACSEGKEELAMKALRTLAQYTDTYSIILEETGPKIWQSSQEKMKARFGGE